MQATMHNHATGELCQHCENGTVFVRWGFVQHINGQPAKNMTGPFAVEYTIHQLIAARDLSPAAQDMRAEDICHQFNETNGGEVWLTQLDDDAPWWALRTRANPDGTEPAMWATFCEDEKMARLLVECGQFDACCQTGRLR